MTYSALPQASANTVLTAEYLNLTADNLRGIGKHNHSGSAGEGNSTVVTASAASGVYAAEYIICGFAPSQSNWNTCSISADNVFGVRLNTGNVPATLDYPVALLAGSYVFEGLFSNIAAGQGGIASLFIGQTSGTLSSMGEVDTYSATLARNQRKRIEGIVVGTSGSYVLRLRADGDKNGSSAASAVYVGAVVLRRVR